MKKEYFKKFTPLVFLASLGAGGIAVMPFALMQYTMPHGKGLISILDITHDKLSLWQNLYFYSLEGVMILFALLHFLLTAIFLKKLLEWLRTESFKETLYEPLKSATLMTPFISIAMTMNVFIGPVRYFIPWMAQNLQSLMFPALLFWLLLWLAVMFSGIKILKISFSKGFDVDKINFGWLLHPFALGMLTVVGTGIAAMSQNTSIASTAAFFSLVSGLMGLFLMTVKLILIFKSHFSAEKLPDKQFMPSFLIIIPNITLYAISAFRFGHFMHNHLGFNTEMFSFLVIVLGFAFEVWYLMFGIALMGDYFRKHFFKKEFYITQWGLICPFVAFGVLGSFFHSLFLGNFFVYSVILASIALSAGLYAVLLKRQYLCRQESKKEKEMFLSESASYNCLD